MNEEHEPQIPLPTRILIGIVCASADTIDIVLLGSGIPIGDFIAFPITQLYLIIKGIDGRKMLVGNLAELPPLLDAIPIRTAMWIKVCIEDSNPKAEAVLEAVSGAITKFPGRPSAEKSPIGQAPSVPAEPTVKTPKGEGTGRLRVPAQEPEGGGGISETAFGLPEEPMTETRREMFEETAGIRTETKREEQELPPRKTNEEDETLERLGWGIETKRVIEKLEKTPGIEDIEKKSEARRSILIDEKTNTVNLKDAA